MRPRASLDDAGWTELREACPAAGRDGTLDLALAKRAVSLRGRTESQPLVKAQAPAGARGTQGSKATVMVDDEERGVCPSQVDVLLIMLDPVMFHLDRSQPLAEWPREGERKLIRRALAGVGHRPRTSLAGGHVGVHPGKRGG